MRLLDEAIGWCLSWIIGFLDDAFLGRCVSWMMRFLDDAFLGWCLSWTMRLDDAFLGWCVSWMMRFLDDAFLGWCFSWICFSWMMCFLDDVFLGWCVSWMIRFLDDAFLGWCISWWCVSWMMRFRWCVSWMMRLRSNHCYGRGGGLDYRLQVKLNSWSSFCVIFPYLYDMYCKRALVLYIKHSKKKATLKRNKSCKFTNLKWFVICMLIKKFLINFVYS